MVGQPAPNPRPVPAFADSPGGFIDQLDRVLDALTDKLPAVAAHSMSPHRHAGRLPRSGRPSGGRPGATTPTSSSTARFADVPTSSDGLIRLVVVMSFVTVIVNPSLRMISPGHGENPARPWVTAGRPHRALATAWPQRPLVLFWGQSSSRMEMTQPSSYW